MAVGALMASCSQEDPTLFGGESDGYYFNYNSADDMTATINFADSIVTNPEVGYVPLRSDCWAICPSRLLLSSSRLSRLRAMKCRR